MRVIGNRGNTARKLQAVASGALASGDTVIVNANGTVSVIAASSGNEGAGTPVVFEGANSGYTSIAYDSNAQKVVIAYRDYGNSNYGTAIVGTVSGTSISFGNSAVFESDAVDQVNITYDSNAQKVVIAYQDEGNSNRGTAVVGTVSGTSISFGSPVVFNTSLVLYAEITYDSNAQKVVIAYRDTITPGRGTAVVGTVSGTSISFGSPVVFDSSQSDDVAITYDTNAQKVVIVYKDAGNSGYGTAIVGTVSGTSISFGTPTVFYSGNNFDNAIGYDSDAQKVVIAYKGPSSYGTAIVGTVSSTSISFGSGVVIESDIAIKYQSVVYDTRAKKIVIAYMADGAGDLPKVVIGTVSGTSISVGSPFVLAAGVETEFNSATYDANAQKVVIVYSNSTNSGYGTSVVYQAAYNSTTLTAENYIGIASNGYASGQAATINAKGFIDDNQSSLTAGQSYFVQTNGDLGTTAANPSVFAGTAVSATKLIVKG